MIDEYRRVRRRRVEQAVHVVDTMTDTVIGRLGNVSESGMLMVASTPLMVDALYQVRFALGDSPSGGEPIEVGAHLLWQDEGGPAGTTGPASASSRCSRARCCSCGSGWTRRAAGSSRGAQPAPPNARSARWNITASGTCSA